MKPILIDINKMSDSRELYETRPNPWFSVLIYTMLTIVIVALTWMYFGRIDIVVKSDGIIRPNSQVATVINTYGGKLEEVYIKDGSSVEEGDILYIIEHEELLDELKYYEDQLSDTEDTIQKLGRYKKSIEDETNYFENKEDEEEYYTKTKSYLLNYKLAESDVTYTAQERQINLSSIKDQLIDLNSKLKNTQRLKEATEKNHNLFSKKTDDQEYYNKFLKYQSDYKSIEQKYMAAGEEIESSTTNEGLVNSYEYYSAMLEGLRTLKASIEKEEDLFEEESSYSLQYKEYQNKLEELNMTYEQAKETYEVNKALEGLAISSWEVEQSKVVADNAERAINTYKDGFMNSIITNIGDLEQNIDEIVLNKDSTQSKGELIARNKEEEKSALDNFRLQHILELDNIISSLNNNIQNLELNRESLILQDEKVLLDDEGVDINLLEYKNREISNTIDNIDTYENRKIELEASIDKIKLQIENAVVKATRSGVINKNMDLVPGNILQNGLEVLSIIPKADSDYKVNIYVSNSDIGKIEQGMQIKFNVYALPNTEYGYLTGTVVNISKDLKVDNNSGSAYYLVEAKLDSSKLYNSKGQEGNLKAGMACQAQMVTENKRILVYVLDKLNLWMGE